MAMVNSFPVDFNGLNFAQIGEKILEVTPHKTGVGIEVVLTEDEEMVFCQNFGFKVGNALMELIGDALKKSGVSSQGLGYVYSNLRFVIQSKIS